MKNGLVVLAVALASCAHTAQPIKWERGYKTDRVIATRHGATLVGYTIKFEFPLNAYDCDRVEVSEFIADRGGHIYEGGGFPGAPAYALFKGVTDDKSADSKMLAMLPAFDKLLSDISAGRTIVKSPAQIERQKKREEHASDCAPEVDGGFTMNMAIYKCDETTKRWVVNEAATQKWAQDVRVMEAHYASLAFALVSRVLTDKEMQEVESLGINLYVRNMQQFFEKDLHERLNGALLQQFKLRDASRSEKSR